MTMRWITDMSVISHCGYYTIAWVHSAGNGTRFEAWFNSQPPRLVAAECATLSEAKNMCEQHHRTNQR